MQRINYKLPYDFILQYLHPVRPKVKKMLGCYGLFAHNKLLMLLRDLDNNPEFNGVFVATQPGYFDSLQTALHSSKMDIDIDGAAHTWIFISEDLPGFDEKVKQACEMIKAGDERIGKPYNEQ